MSFGPIPKFVPTPAHIAAETAEIRKTWSPKETILRKRGVQMRGVHREEPGEREIEADQFGNPIEPVHITRLRM